MTDGFSLISPKTWCAHVTQLRPSSTKAPGQAPRATALQCMLQPAHRPLPIAVSLSPKRAVPCHLVQIRAKTPCSILKYGIPFQASPLSHSACSKAFPQHPLSRVRANPVSLKPIENFPRHRHTPLLPSSRLPGPQLSESRREKKFRGHPALPRKLHRSWPAPCHLLTGTSLPAGLSQRKGGGGETHHQRAERRRSVLPASPGTEAPVSSPGLCASLSSHANLGP